MFLRVRNLSSLISLQFAVEQLGLIENEEKSENSYSLTFAMVGLDLMAGYFAVKKIR